MDIIHLAHSKQLAPPELAKMCHRDDRMRVTADYSTILEKAREMREKACFSLAQKDVSSCSALLKFVPVISPFFFVE